MATENKGRIILLVGLAVIAMIALIAVSNRRPAAEPEAAAESPAAAPAPPNAFQPLCHANADCPAGQACVVPGKCSQTCKTESDCPGGRACAELRAMTPPPENPAAVTVMTCVQAR